MAVAERELAAAAAAAARDLDVASSARQQPVGQRGTDIATDERETILRGQRDSHKLTHQSLPPVNRIGIASSPSMMMA